MDALAVGLFYCECHQDLTRQAALCIASIKRHLPAHIVHFSDRSTRRLDGADEIVRLSPGHFGLMEFRIHHYASYPHEAALFLDLDTIVQCDVSDILRDTFDVALTLRSAKKLLCDGEDRIAQMPYNTGVMFSRGNAFWDRVARLMRPLSIDDRNWFGEQEIIGRLAKSGEFRVRELPDTDYNYTPSTKDEDVSGRKIVHYKGNRKEWMCESL